VPTEIPAAGTPSPSGELTATVTPVEPTAPLSGPAVHPPKAAAVDRPRPKKRTPAFTPTETPEAAADIWKDQPRPKKTSPESGETEGDAAESPDHLQGNQESSTLQTPTAKEALPENAGEETSPEAATPSPDSEPEPADGQEAAESSETPTPEENP
jgi:hypothetical protein